MSTAAIFKHQRAFPFCPYDISAEQPFCDYIDGLTLAEAMAFYWNLEDVTFNFVATIFGTSGGGSPITKNATGYFTVSGLGSDLWDAVSYYGGGWHGYGYGSGLTRQPRERVCVDVFPGVPPFAPPTPEYAATVLALGHSSLAHVGNVEFYIGTNPAVPSVYRIYYSMKFKISTGTVPGAGINFYSNAFSAEGWTPITSGTMTIGGVIFPWYSEFYGDSFADGTMSASQTMFTY